MEAQEPLTELADDPNTAIYFSDHVFGKATKNRKEDPSMFELLSWGTQGFERHSFKKTERFKDSTAAYMNSIAKHSWTSENKDNYVNYQDGCVNVNPDLMRRIQEFIE